MNAFHSCAHGLTLLVYSILMMASASANALKLTSSPEVRRSSSCLSNFSQTVGRALCQILQSRSTWDRMETSFICCLSSPQHQVSSVCKQQKSVDSSLSLSPPFLLLRVNYVYMYMYVQFRQWCSHQVSSAQQLLVVSARLAESASSLQSVQTPW